MGNAGRKLGDAPDERTGLSPRQVKLVQDSWHEFCSSNREYGVLLFLSMFIKHPEYLRMFPNFRGKPVGALKDDPVFRAHGCAIGYHLTSMVDSLNEPATFEVLARRNGAEHLKRKGVKPAHFVVMGGCLVDVLRAKNEKLMTPDTIEAWGKFLTAFVAFVKDVYDADAAQRTEKGSSAIQVAGQDEVSAGAASSVEVGEGSNPTIASAASTLPKKKPGARKSTSRRTNTEDKSKAASTGSASPKAISPLGKK